MAGKVFGIGRRKGTAQEGGAGQAGAPQQHRTAQEGGDGQAGAPQPGAARGRAAGAAPVPAPGIGGDSSGPRASDLSLQARDLFNERQFTAAIPLFQEAIDLIRASPRSHLRPYQGMLGLNLCLQALCYRQTGSMREALVAAEESAAVLTAISGPESFLLRSLETVARSLDALSERPEDKAAAAVRAADLLARTNDPEPDLLGRRLHMLDLAANVLNDSGRIPEALRLRKDAVEAARSIAETYPARRHRLAMQYSSLAVLHAKTGEFVEASAAGDACAASMSDPEFTSSPASRFMTAQNLFVLGRLLVQGSYRREALRPYLLAIDNFRVLRSDTSRPAESKLALCLNNHAWNLCVLEEPDEALPFADEAVGLMRSLAESAPTERGLLASYLDSLATALAMSGRTDEALTACREALDIRRELAAADPEKHQAKVASIEKLEALIRGSESGSFTER